MPTRGTVVEEYIEWNESPDVPRRKDLLDLSSGIWLPLLPAFELHALLGECDFILCQIEGLGDFGKIRQCEEAKQCDGQGDDAIDNEKPLPSLEAAASVELVYTSHQVTREHGCDGAAGVEDTRSFGEFFPSIPGSDDVLHAWVERTFSKTNKKAQGVDGFCVIGAAKTECQDGPCKLLPLVHSFHYRITRLSYLHSWYPN